MLTFSEMVKEVTMGLLKNPGERLYKNVAPPRFINYHYDTLEYGSEKQKPNTQTAPHPARRAAILIHQ